MKKNRLVFLFSLLICTGLFGQDTLPRFTLKNMGNKRIVIGWANPFSDVVQISIQRSMDSLAGFKTILTVPDPTTPQNGYVDANPAHDRMFYRLYIMREKGIFLFSDPKRPVVDTGSRVSLPNGTGNLSEINPGNAPNLPNKITPSGFVPSLYVFTHRDGNVRVSLPDTDKPKKFNIKFFGEDDSFLFELKDLKEKNFKIDKASFLHAGWFRFELYEDGKLYEKHKFYLEKDF